MWPPDHRNVPYSGRASLTVRSRLRAVYPILEMAPQQSSRDEKEYYILGENFKIYILKKEINLAHLFIPMRRLPSEKEGRHTKSSDL